MAEASAPDFAAVWAEHGAMVGRIVQSYEADAELARDVAQDVALALWRALPRFRGDCALRTFVARVAHNRAVSHVVRAAGRPRFVEVDETLACEAPDAEALLAARGERERLLAAVRCLPLGYRQPISLLLEGFAHEQIAATLGLSTGAVAVRLTRAKGMLRKLLGAEP